MKSALTRLLGARGLRTPHRRHLSSYRVTDDELAGLRVALGSGGGIVSPESGEWAALFCLFAAEQIRREYDGGPLKWEPILAPLGLNNSILPSLYLRIVRGLQYLGRPILHAEAGDRQFLVTLMCEGGIPLRVLQHDGARLTRFLRNLLGDAERYPTLVVTETAQRLAGTHLPVSLRNDMFIELAARLIEAVRDLRAGRTDGACAVADLDIGDPTWRDRLPLAIDDESAQRLLDGLLTSPRQEVESGSRLALDTFLLLGSGGPRLVRQLQLVDHMSESVVASYLQREAGSSVPTRLRLQLAVAEGERSLLGSLVQRSVGDFVLQSATTPAVLETAARFTPIAFAQGTQHLGMVAVPGGDSLGEGPWVFLPMDEQRNRLCAVGSCRKQSSHLVVALPEWGPAEEEGLIVELGNVDGRRLVSLAGSLRWTVDGAHVVVTSLVSDRPRRFSLRGRVRRFWFLDRVVFVGVPDVIEQSDDGHERLVDRNRLQLRPPGPGASWRWGSSVTLGEARLRVLDDDESVFSTSVAVVPEDFRVDLEPSGVGGTGKVRVTSAALQSIGASKGDFTYSYSRKGTSHVLEVTSASPRPAPIELTLRFAGGDLAGRVPFPGTFLGFTDRRGELISSHAPLSVRALSGLHACYLAPPGQLPKEIDVEARLDRQQPEYVGHLTKRGDQGNGKELHLEAIRERLDLMFASGTGPDDELHVTLAERGGVVSKATGLKLRRYEASLVPEKSVDHQVIRFSKMANAVGSFDGLRVEAVPLWHPLDDPQLLTTVPDGGWVFQYVGRAVGPWLLSGWVGQDMCCRPLCATVPGAAVEPSRTTLEELTRRADEGRRVEGFAELCELLAVSWDHPEWVGMDEFLATLGVFPTYTFDAVRALVRCPGTAILAALRAQTPSDLSRRWKRFEDLPFSWFMLPLQSWMRAGVALQQEAARRARACREGRIPGDWGLERLVRDLLPQLVAPAVPPFVESVKELWPRALAGFPAAPTGLLMQTQGPVQLAAIVLAIISEQTRSLQQRHSEDRWPQVHLEDIDRETRDLAEQQTAKWSTNVVGFQRDVLRVPVIAAAVMVSGHSPSDQTIRSIRRIRAFDEDWFDQAHALALTSIVSTKLSDNASFLDDLAGV